MEPIVQAILLKVIKIKNFLTGSNNIEQANVRDPHLIEDRSSKYQAGFLSHGFLRKAN